MTPAPARGVSAWNVANALTVLRVLLVPVFAWLLLHDGGQDALWRVAAAGAFLLAVVTDRLDGEIARRYGLVTDFGKIADPIADKALIGTALVGLSLLGELWWEVSILIIVRELGVTLLRFVVIRHGVMPASRGGKLKTVLQSVAIFGYVLPLDDPWRWPIHAVMAAAVVVTLVTGVDYVLQAVRLRRGSERTARRRAARRGGAGARR